MADVFTKGEILQNLASKGYFIDSYTLDTFLAKWKVEAIFEDEQGSEFYDKNTCDLIMSNLFNQKIQQENEAINDVIVPIHQQADETIEKTPNPTPTIQTVAQKQPMYFDNKIEDSETAAVLNNISLSDGTPLINKISDIPIPDIPNLEIKSFSDINLDIDQKPAEIKKEKKVGILEGAMQAAGQEYKPQETTQEETISQEDADYDDMSLLSESFEAQEKFKEYVISELSKKNVDLTPKSNEFKLDISERTLSMIARTMAKKIAKHVSAICSQDAQSSAKLDAITQENKKLEKKAKELEEQNRKLRLLLAESNKNLNSYVPSIFGLYKKVPHNK